MPCIVKLMPAAEVFRLQLVVIDDAHSVVWLEWNFERTHRAQLNNWLRRVREVVNRVVPRGLNVQFYCALAVDREFVGERGVGLA